MSASRGERVPVPRVWLGLVCLLVGVLGGGHANTDVAVAAGHQHAISAALSDVSAHAGAPLANKQFGHSRVDVGVTGRVELATASVDTHPTRAAHTTGGTGHVARVPRAPPV